MISGVPSLAGRARPAPPCTLVIFGVTGDLTRRLLLPALYNLSRWGLLSEDFSIIGIGRTQMTADELRRELTDAVCGFIKGRQPDAAAHGIDEAAWNRVIGRLDYIVGDAGDPAVYAEIGKRIAGETGGAKRRNVLFYLAVAARFFGPIVKQLGKAGLTKEGDDDFRRVIIEKPFGHDLVSAGALNRDVLGVLRESQIFRIDHYLGKETVQNIMAFRFGNGIFEPLWNRDRIDHVQITVAEAVGVERRGTFYDSTGALRDMVPNHLVQLFTMTAMEPPTSFAADAVRDKREEVLAAVRKLTRKRVATNVVRAQYTAGMVRGRELPDYREEPDVAQDSTTETYVAMRLVIDNWRWAGVPFYLRTGKAMTRRDTEIAIRFKQAPLSLFRHTGMTEPVPNWLVMQIQPEEGISLQFGAKVPGPELQLSAVDMGFFYKDYFRAEPSTGYETLVYDAMIGDATLFQRADNIEAGWRLVQPILDAWAEGEDPMATYPAGSAGPAAADALLERDGRAWRPL
jgi:glucose-6-phosphate 1-dehydrogenase